MHTKQIHTFIISGHLKNSLFRLCFSCAAQLSKNSFKLLWLYGNGLSTERKQGKRREKGGEYQGKRKEEGEKGANGRREKEKRERMRKLGTRMGWMKEGEEEVGRKKRGEEEWERKKGRGRRRGISDQE